MLRTITPEPALAQAGAGRDASAVTSDHARARLTAAIVRLGAGDKAALDEIYRATSAKLFGICLRILGDRKEAEDALQDVYLSLYRGAARFDPARASPISWVAVFARNRAIDRLRRLKARPVVADNADAELTNVRDPGPAADAMMIDSERSARIHRCLDALDEEQRAPLRSAFFGGFTYAELAERGGVPLATMKSRIRRGLAKMKICLEAGE